MNLSLHALNGGGQAKSFWGQKDNTFRCGRQSMSVGLNIKCLVHDSFAGIELNLRTEALFFHGVVDIRNPRILRNMRVYGTSVLKVVNQCCAE